jgi:CRISPR-associated protein Csm3
MTDIKLYGRVIITGQVKALTGLHIGGSSTGLEIGGLDKAVIRNPYNGQPYIPGSSLRGKMRSLTEKILGLKQNNPIGQVTIHTCRRKEEYEKDGGCPVCHIYGVPAELDFSFPTRLFVRDIALEAKSALALDQANTELRYAELKTEVAIDRVTSAATPRTLERVPAGAVFAPVELVFSIYEAADFQRLKLVLEALQLVEDDYLGGAGSRGSGKVQFTGLEIAARSAGRYGEPLGYARSFDQVQALVEDYPNLKNWLEKSIPLK